MSPGTLEHLERLEAEWKSLQPLEALREERLWQKLRLEWNFHSNHIEGNTLTYGETAAFLLHDQTSGLHTGREYAEMKGHDLAIELVRDLAKAPQDLTEVDIRNLNQILLKEQFYKVAETRDGSLTRTLITPGRYKEQPNKVHTVTGELFEYALPMDVPLRMGKLLEAVRNCAIETGLEFMTALAMTHHEFTAIHPFDDGNGRVARLLTNYLLLRKGLLPLRVPTGKKTNYLAALRLADQGDPLLLSDFFTEQLTWSLELGIKAAKGESLEEPSDIEKEIALFAREQKSNKKQILKTQLEVLRQFVKTNIRSFGKKLEEKSKNLNDLFESNELLLSIEGNYGDGYWQAGFRISDNIDIQYIPNQAQLKLTFQNYTGESSYSFGIEKEIIFHLEKEHFAVEYYNEKVYRASYLEGISTQKIDEIIAGFLKELFQQIKAMAHG